MKILFIAPLPPPIHGHSLASKVFLDDLSKEHQVIVVDMAKKKDEGVLGTTKRFFKVTQILLKISRHVQRTDVIYLTISESIFGNIKDLFIYIICFRRLEKMFIHLHGGAGMLKIMRNRYSILARINIFFISRLKGAIILGESHRQIFEGAIPSEKIHIVPNFAEDYLFINNDELYRKFHSQDKINILFLSNLINGKGYIELLHAFISLPSEIRSRMTLDFAGAFDSESSKKQFMDKIKGIQNITYHGVVTGHKKKMLFHRAQVFCLPTYYPFEGQPISILEAYAAGCVVITTNHSGINDIFTDNINGYKVEKKSHTMIAQKLEYICNFSEKLLYIARHNRKIAEEKYTTSIFNYSLKKIITPSNSEDLQ